MLLVLSRVYLDDIVVRGLENSIRSLARRLDGASFSVSRDHGENLKSVDIHVLICYYTYDICSLIINSVACNL